MTLSRRSIERPPKIEARNGPAARVKTSRIKFTCWISPATRSVRLTRKYISPSRVRIERSVGPRAPSNPLASRRSLPCGPGGRDRSATLIAHRPPRQGISGSAPVTSSRSDGHSDAIHEVTDDRLGRAEFARLEERLAHDTVRQHRHRQVL